MNNLKVGDKLRCKNTINNVFRWPLFDKDGVYEILDIQDNMYFINHILYANEYADFDENFIKENFEKIK